MEACGKEKIENGLNGRELGLRKVEKGDCPIRDQFVRDRVLTEAEVVGSLKESGVVGFGSEVDGADREGWRKALHESEKNFLEYSLQKDLRKKTVALERFETLKLEGALDLEYKKQIDVRGKVILAPLTTVGNLPFRRLCKKYGADITVGEMAIAEHVLKGEKDEWALLRRHKSEDIFGVQLAGNLSDIVGKASEIVNKKCDVDFIDLNAGCPIDMVCKKGAGCDLLRRKDKLRGVVRKGSALVDVPFSVKMRTGISNDPAGWNAHQLIPKMKEWGASWVTLHGRSKEQRYKRTADWNYIDKCRKIANDSGLPLVGNGDIFSFEDAQEAFTVSDAIMVARGAIIKPWIFAEIKEARYIDMTAGQRLEMYKEFSGYCLDHYGADDRGREASRKYLLEWLCFTCRYPPVGIFEEYGERLDELRPRLNLRIPAAVGRDPLEMTLSSRDPRDWIRVSEYLLGPVPNGYKFAPKHVGKAWSSEAGMAFQK
ncbi:hypothetical protein NDN08_001854 [Rhodosorus marinus]|uniref:tRNA-dihydrouridine(47) synthase [NAD(P)(+)] n=1 Tax=Rhodosorus marinus TaxID=101924 RepID=A0AAV8UWB7_9RHOD|nr:hypothetical protein NDN08_001854 [Rhodosorus marinus]